VKTSKVKKYFYVLIFQFCVSMSHDQDRFYDYTCRHSKLVYAAAERIRDCDKTTTTTTTITTTVTTITYKTSTTYYSDNFDSNEISTFDDKSTTIESELDWRKV